MDGDKFNLFLKQCHIPFDNLVMFSCTREMLSHVLHVFALYVYVTDFLCYFIIVLCFVPCLGICNVQFLLVVP